MSKWASDKNHKLIFENWRGFLNEEEEREVAPEEKETPQEEAPAQARGLVNINAGPEHVLKAVPKLLQDPKLKNIIRSGRSDAAGPGDEVIKIVKGTRTASALEPTQSQIGTEQSLIDQVADEDFDKGEPTNLTRAIKGGKLASRAGLFPILVFKNHILDGHHRWSQFITTNPGATVDVVEIKAAGVGDAKTALALLHYMNFALFGKSPTKDFKGVNVYTMNRDAIYQMALKNMGKTTPGKLAQAGLIKEPTAEAAAAHFADNLSNLSGPGDYPRLAMPQPGDAGSPDGYATTPEPAAQGVVNYDDPVPQDIKKAAEALRHAGRLLERAERHHTTKRKK